MGSQSEANRNAGRKAAHPSQDASGVGAALAMEQDETLSRMRGRTMSERAMPKKVAALPEVPRDQAHQVVSGMGVVRKLLFCAPVSHDGWQKQMLTHIAAAKSLGFTMFEIDTAEILLTRQKSEKKKEASNGMYISFTDVFGSAHRVEGDEWKDGVQPATEAPNGKTEAIRTTAVTVYALAVE